MFSSCTSTANYHNVALRAVKSSELTAAVAAKNISAWSGNVYTSSYELPEIAPLATVNGVGYTVPTTLAAALIGNDEAEVKLLHAFSEEIVVSRPAVINTNGLAHNFVICEGGSVKQDGDILTFTSPYIANDHIVGEGINPGTGTSATIDAGDAMFEAVYYNADDNLFAKVVYQNYFFKENFRTSYLMTDPESGNKYLYDTVYSGNPAGQKIGRAHV